MEKAQKHSVPILSIITVCYNEKEMERTCKSITEQTFQDFEWIIKDGGSNGETLGIIEKYKKRADIFISKKDTGIYNAMNKGIELAKGKWLLFMNGGDSFFEKTTLEKIFTEEKKAFKNADIVYCASNFHEADGRHYIREFKEKLDCDFWSKDCLCHQSSFIKKELFDKFGPYTEEFKISGDLEKWILFQKKGCKFKRLKNIVSNYYKIGLSAQNEELCKKEREIILDRYCKYDFITSKIYRLFGFQLLRLQKRRDGKKTRLRLF